MAAKGYIDFDTFKEKYPSKPRKFRCPRCKKYSESIITNIFGKRMCVDCFQEENKKVEEARKKREIKEAKSIEEIDEETETFDI